MNAQHLPLAEELAALAHEMGVQTALIGAAAVAAHGYVRATADIDLATSIEPRPALQRLQEAVERRGYRTELRMPDDEDPLGGVLEVWRPEDVDEDGDPVASIELINFHNPARPRPSPAHAAVMNAEPFEEGSKLRVVRLPDLVALKLMAAGPTDRFDIGRLLEANRDADLDEIRRVAGPFDEAHILETLIAEAAQTRPR